MDDTVELDRSKFQDCDTQLGKLRHVVLVIDGLEESALNPDFLNNEHCHAAEAMREAVCAAQASRISYLTILMPSSKYGDCASCLEILKRFIHENVIEMRARNVRINIIGAPWDIFSSEAESLREKVEATAPNTGMTLLLALKYGTRESIVAAVRSLAGQVAMGRLDPAEVDANKIGMSLETADIPDPDLIIRTSGKRSLSNVLLWQSAYSEFVFLPITWRDFSKGAFDAAVAEYMRRERRFGGLTAGSTPLRQIGWVKGRRIPGSA